MTLPQETKWELKDHDEFERPYWEITNGPISMCVDDEDITEEHIAAMKDIVRSLNSGGIHFRSENALEVKQYCDIELLKDELRNEKEGAQRLVDTLEFIKTYGPCDERTVKFIDKALAKYKEVGNEK